jgi:modulator of FtsH protease HflC
VTRGEADAISTRTYSEAFSRDKEFYDFYRTLQAYRQVLSGSDTTMVLTPDNEFLKYLKDEKP